ncbi:hypothetical protein BGX24_012103 [Mortierella sp. AD032]|nr:hypothetical protein BGX24_012103 [Mortierella sp. AD032]
MTMTRVRHTAAATPIGALDALLHSISTAGDLTDNHIMSLMHIVGQQGNVATTSVLGALRILDNPGSILVRESLMCEHVLAAKLTEALGTLEETEISAETFADLP